MIVPSPLGDLTVSQKYVEHGNIVHKFSIADSYRFGIVVRFSEYIQAKNLAQIVEAKTANALESLARFWSDHPDHTPMIGKEIVLPDDFLPGFDASLYRIVPKDDAVHTVYRIAHRDTGKTYIGRSKHFEARIAQHARSDSSALYDDIARYGIAAFDCEALIRGLTQNEAVDIETATISQLMTIAPNGYNRINGYFA